MKKPRRFRRCNVFLVQQPPNQQGAQGRLRRYGTEASRDLTKRFYAFRPAVYVCSASHPTIGYRNVVLAQELDQFAERIM